MIRQDAGSSSVTTAERLDMEHGHAINQRCSICKLRRFQNRFKIRTRRKKRSPWTSSRSGTEWSTSVRFLDILRTSSGAARKFSKSTACLTTLVCKKFHWLAFSVKPAVVLSFKNYLQQSHRSVHEGVLWRSRSGSEPTRPEIRA